MKIKVDWKNVMRPIQNKGLNPPSSNPIIIDIRGVEGTEKL